MERIIEPDKFESIGAEHEYSDGFLDYSTRNAVRDLVRRYGPEEARARLDQYLNDECDRSRRQ